MTIHLPALSMIFFCRLTDAYLIIIIVSVIDFNEASDLRKYKEPDR